MSYNLFYKIAQADSTTKERSVSQIQNDIIADFYDSPSYHSVTIGENSLDVQIVDENSIIKLPNKKRMLALPNETFNIGETVVWDNNNWLVTNLDSDIEVQTKGIIERCNNTLNLYQTQILLEIPCIVSAVGAGMGLSTDETKYILEPSDTIYVRIPNNEDTQLIKINDVYKIGMWNYKVESVSDTIEVGLLVLKMCFTAEEQVLPDIEEPTPTSGLSVEITGSTSITKGGSKTYSCIFTDDDAVIIDTSVYYLTSDDGVSVTTLAEITSQDGTLNTCIVRGINLGYVKLWVKNVAETVVSEALRIQIKNVF